MGDALRKSTRSETTGATVAMGGGDGADPAGEQRTSDLPRDGNTAFPEPRGDVCSSSAVSGGDRRRSGGAGGAVDELGQAAAKALIVYVGFCGGVQRVQGIG